MTEDLAVEHTATVYEVRHSRRDDVRLLLATCNRCEADVMHGGGSLSAPVLLDTRAAHCKCPGVYTLVLAPGVDAS